jgi:hypothetical protein
MDLKGCVHDALRFRKCIIKYFNFKVEDIDLIVDEQVDWSKPNGLERKKYDNISISEDVILEALFDLVKGAKEGDIRIFYFAGHGNRYKEQTYNNSTGYIEYLVCGKGNIYDHWIRAFARIMPENSLFAVVTDSCHSGGIMEGAVEQIGDSCREPVTGKAIYKAKPYIERESKNGKLGVLMSACQSYQTTKEFYREDKGHFAGYFTNEFIKLIEATHGNITNFEMIDTIRKVYGKNRNISMRPGLYCEEDQKNLKLFSLAPKEAKRKRS